MTQDLQATLNEICGTFKEEGNDARRQQMSDYMRGQFDYFGITSPIRKELSKPFIVELSKLDKDIVFEIIENLWQQPQRELHYLAQELFYKISKKRLEKEDLPFIESLITRNSWWDTIDFIAPKIVKIYFDMFPEERDKVVAKWIKSDNIWLNRSALLMNLKQKDDIDFDHMFATIIRLTGTKEFFINKAIGWLLREHSKKHPELIQEFITNNKNSLSNLSIREGSKYLN